MSTMQVKSKRTPAGMHALSPHLVCDGAAEAIDFYRRAFGATEMVRLPGPDGRLIHATVLINGSSVMLVDANPARGLRSPRHLDGTPVTIHLIVDDVDAVVARAVEAGATVKMPVADMFWGDRYGIIEDPSGHNWSIATHMRDMTQAEMRAAAERAMCGQPAA